LKTEKKLIEKILKLCFDGGMNLKERKMMDFIRKSVESGVVSIEKKIMKNKVK